jgi:hypothetical protein
VRFAFSGFGAPIDGEGVLNVARAGQVIALSSRLTDAAGKPVTTLSGVTVAMSVLSCGVGSNADDLDQYASGARGSRTLAMVTISSTGRRRKFK